MDKKITGGTLYVSDIDEDGNAKNFKPIAFYGSGYYNSKLFDCYDKPFADYISIIESVKNNERKEFYIDFDKIKTEEELNDKLIDVEKTLKNLKYNGLKINNEDFKWDRELLVIFNMIEKVDIEFDIKYNYNSITSVKAKVVYDCCEISDFFIYDGWKSTGTGIDMCL